MGERNVKYAYSEYVSMYTNIKLSTYDDEKYSMRCLHYTSVYIGGLKDLSFLGFGLLAPLCHTILTLVESSASSQG